MSCHYPCWSKNPELNHPCKLSDICTRRFHHTYRNAHERSLCSQHNSRDFVTQVKYLIAILQSAEPVRSHNHGELAGKAEQRLKQLSFRRDVQRAGCFVQNQQRWTMIKRASKTDPLTLPARKADAALANFRLKAVAQIRFNEVQYLRHTASFAQAHGIDLLIRQTKRDVARDRVVDEKNILRHVTDRCLP